MALYGGDIADGKLLKCFCILYADALKDYILKVKIFIWPSLDSFCLLAIFFLKRNNYILPNVRTTTGGA